MFNYNALQALHDKFMSFAEGTLSHHPFDQLSSKAQIISLFPHFLGVSVAFPYLQAGSQLSLIVDAIDDNRDVSEDIEITSVVGNFLSWEETGGSYVLGTFGKAGLPKILKTKTWFHANLLRKDMERLTGNPPIPNFAEPTRSYLLSLLKGLSHANPIIRVAYMTAFEVHANTVIKSLWKGIGRNFEINPDDLIYFKFHVGGEDPAEAYHVSMVSEMLRKIVKPEEEEAFMLVATKALYENLNWCEAISNLSSETPKGLSCGIYRG